VTREAAVAAPLEPRGQLPLCPVDRLPRRRRNQICIALMALGALNMLAYPVVYAFLGGDAHNGRREVVHSEGGETRTRYFIRGHHLQSLAGRETPVSRATWLFSYAHSISLLMTNAAMLIAMLILARPHIVATMRNSWIRGETFVRMLAGGVAAVTLTVIVFFVWDLAVQLARG
jgi:hypothetical protein